MLISVIVPVYNVEAYLGRCVDSLLAQTYENLEIILVDDGAKDWSGKICDEYAAKDPRIRVIHKENGGLSSARNAGLDVARGEYLAFADSDDWVEPGAYEAMLKLALERDVKLVCAGRYDVESATGEKRKGLCPPETEVISGQELVHRIFLWDNVDSAAWDKLYHRSLFRQIRYPLGKIVEDVPVTYRIALDAGKAAMLDMPVYNYFHRPGSITAAPVSEKTFHFSQHTEQIYNQIRQSCPELTEEARYLRVRSLVHNLWSLDMAGKEAKAVYGDEYRSSRKALRKHMGFLLTSRYLKKQERLTDILLALGIYWPLRRLYHTLKSLRSKA